MASMDQAVSAMQELYQKYERRAGSSPELYMLQHARLSVIKRQIYSCDMYMRYVSGRVLDWGCRHAPDGCLLRYFKGDGIELYGCDAAGASDYSSFKDFHEYAGLHFTPLEHPFLLPYSDSFFNVVVSSGVLEHVPNDYE